MIFTKYMIKAAATLRHTSRSGNTDSNLGYAEGFPVFPSTPKQTLEHYLKIGYIRSNSLSLRLIITHSFDALRLMSLQAPVNTQNNKETRT